MEWRHEIAADRLRLTITAWGPATVEGLVAILTDSMKLPDWRPDLVALLDFRELDISTLSQPDIERLAAEYRRFAGVIGAAPIAVLVSRPVDFGLVRMWEILVDTMNLRHAVFYDEAAAEAWLRSA